MKAMIAHIDLIIECRDYRTPLVSRNPMFEETLGEKPRLIVYTKQDLGSTGRPNVNRKVSQLHSHTLQNLSDTTIE